jgi:RNA 2',3'-cyclic 3'-phosphodiesterase
VTRAFVAVELPNVVLSAVAARVAGLNIRGGRTTTADQWHLTLEFLGNDANVDAVAAALDRFSVPGGPVRLGGAGAFPNARQARVVWVGVPEGSDVLARLASEVAERLARIGFEPEARPFRPHLTLVRCASPTDVRAAIAAFGSDPVGPAWNVETLTVFESQLRREGARYLERASVALPG